MRVVKYLPLMLFFLAGYCLTGCATPSSIVVERAGTAMDDGKLFVYVDTGGPINEKQPIAKGQTKTFSVANGGHTIWVKVDNLESDKIRFTSDDNTVNFKVSTDRVAGTKYLMIEQIADEK